MKTKQMTLSNSPSQRMLQVVAAWLHRPNAFLSQLLACDVSNQSLLCAVAFSLCGATAVLFASDACKLYGWASFFALLSLNCVIPFFREINNAEER